MAEVSLLPVNLAVVIRPATMITAAENFNMNPVPRMVALLSGCLVSSRRC